MKNYCFKNSTFRKYKERLKKKIVLNYQVFRIKLFIEDLFLEPIARKKGQVIVEYILLLVISTVIALVLINLVSVIPGTPGSPVLNYWKHLLEVIGQDIST